MSAPLADRAAALAWTAIGKSIAIRVRRATLRRSGLVVRGVVTRCEYDGERRTATQRIARFRVWLEGRAETFVVERLPR